MVRSGSFPGRVRCSAGGTATDRVVEANGGARRQARLSVDGTAVSPTQPPKQAKRCIIALRSPQSNTTMP